MIDNYYFGTITIDGEKYNKDVEVRWTGEVLGWRREQGHVFALIDLERALEQKPEVLILGTGAYGVAQVSKEVKQAMKKQDIKLIIDKTGEAIRVFNEIIKQNNDKRVIGLFHLTC